MRDTFRLPILITLTLLVGTASVSTALAQTASPASWEESLSLQYRTGTVLNVMTTGVVGTSGCNVRSTSTFKDGKLHAPGFGQNVLLGTVKCEMHPIAPGTQVYLSALQVILKSNRVAFVVSLCSVGDCSGGFDGALPSQVDFEFPKGFLATAQLAQVQEAIRHVFSVASSPNTPTQGGQVTSVLSPPAPPRLPPTVMAGSLYVNSQNSVDRLTLNTDGSFSLQEGGEAFSGTYVADDATLRLHILQLGKDVDITIRGNTLIVNGQEVWDRQSASDDGLSSRPISLFGAYAKVQNSADRLQLNVDSSFLLQEGGRTYHGKFLVDGNRLVLDISELPGQSATATISADRMVDNEGFTWVRQKQ